MKAEKTKDRRNQVVGNHPSAVNTDLGFWCREFSARKWSRTFSATFAGISLCIQ
jgi:hypothetical protein